MNTKEEILEKHCPSMNNLYLDNQGRNFRDRIIKAMEEYASQQTAELREENEKLEYSQHAVESHVKNLQRIADLELELSDFKALVKQMRDQRNHIVNRPIFSRAPESEYRKLQTLETQVDKYLES
jgi:hypothetical protein